MAARVSLVLLPLILTGAFRAAAIPVAVMMPLDVITADGISNPSALLNNLNLLASKGVSGVMLDVWWGLAEYSGPKQYNFTAYQQLAAIVQRANLNLQPIMSFHQCGGNVGDTCDIPLPPWVLDVGRSHPEVWYTDREGGTTHEYVSLFADDQALFQGRTPVQIYTDYMAAFADALRPYLGTTITVIQVGLGPAGELRYPSYPSDRWRFCGVGEFQSYGSLALASLAQAAQAAGHAEWGHSGPDNAGTYNDYPASVPFFTPSAHANVSMPSLRVPGDNYQSAYGQFFLGWYSGQLQSHAEKILAAAANVFPSNVRLSAKVPGIHWWYTHPSHAAELTAGLFNTDGQDAYFTLASLFGKYRAGMDFTCFEMLDSEQPADCDCGPFELVQQSKTAAHRAGILFAGENALARYDSTAYGTIEQQASALGYPIAGFTYLRLSDTLLQPDNLNTFAAFVSSMHGR